MQGFLQTDTHTFTLFQAFTTRQIHQVEHARYCLLTHLVTLHHSHREDGVRSRRDGIHFSFVRGTQAQAARNERHYLIHGGNGNKREVLYKHVAISILADLIVHCLVLISRFLQSRHSRKCLSCHYLLLFLERRSKKGIAPLS